MSDKSAEILSMDSERRMVTIRYTPCEHLESRAFAPYVDSVTVYPDACPVCAAFDKFQGHNNSEPTYSIGVTNESGVDIEKGDIVHVTASCVRGHYTIAEMLGGIAPPECAHDFIDVGFHHSKWVCSKCNAEREDRR